MKIHIWNHPWTFIVRQVEREFFGTLGFLFGTGILFYGIIVRDSKIQTSSLSATGFREVVFSIPVYVIGIVLVLIFVGYLIIKRKR